MQKCNYAMLFSGQQFRIFDMEILLNFVFKRQFASFPVRISFYYNLMFYFINAMGSFLQ